MQQYKAGVEISPALSTRQTADQRCRTSAKTPEQQIAATASAKLEEGDVKFRCNTDTVYRRQASCG